jgi:predicted NodU family carbamoyl transferase
MILAAYGYHDSSVCLKDGDQYFVYEFERFVQRRYAVLTKWYIAPHQIATDEEFLGFFDHIKQQHKLKEIDVFYHHEIYSEDITLIKKLFDVKEFVRYDHHYAHAASVYRQSSFQDCFII